MDKGVGIDKPILLLDFDEEGKCIPNSAGLEVIRNINTKVEIKQTIYITIYIDRNSSSSWFISNREEFPSKSNNWKTRWIPIGTYY